MLIFKFSGLGFIETHRGLKKSCGFPFLLFILVPYMYPLLFAYRHLFLTLWQGMASCDVKLEVNQNKTISTPPRCWKNQDSFEKEIQVDLIHLTHLRKNPRLFKLMS
jgi:hypothetical protein